MKISTVIVIHKDISCVERCLDSVLKQEGCDQEVIVVDNGCGETLQRVLGRYAPFLRLIHNGGNLGAAKARNQAIAEASGAWVLTLDPDAALAQDFLASFCRFLQNNAGPRLGMVVPKILAFDNKTTYAQGHRLTFLRRFYDLGRGTRDGDKPPDPASIFGPCAAAAFYRREMLQEINEHGAYFDEDFFFMAEDVDLAWRGRRKGWQVGWAPECVCFHEGNSAGLTQAEKDFYSVRNRFLMMAKNDPGWRHVLWGIPLLGYELVRACAYGFRGEGKVYGRAVVSALKILRERKERRA